MKKKFRIVERDGIVIYDESDDYVPGEEDPDMDEDDDNVVYAYDIIDDEDSDDGEYDAGRSALEPYDDDLDTEYFERHATVVKPHDARNDRLVSILVIVSCIAIIGLFILYAVARYS